jgi:hypothetical protein
MSMVRKIGFFVILVYLVCFTTNGYCDDWVYVGSNKGFTLYYKSSTVKIDKKNKTIKVWVKTVYTEKGKNVLLEKQDKQKFADIKHDLILNLFDYQQWKRGFTHITVFSKSDNIILEEEYPPKWSDITPDTVYDTLLNQLLNDFNIKR